MEQELNDLLLTLSKISDFELVDKCYNTPSISFKLSTEESLQIFLFVLDQIKDNHNCIFSQESSSLYKLTIQSEDKSLALKSLNDNFKLAFERPIDEKHKEYGIPDLSLVTIRQMTNELKKRKNLTFALIWIENNEKDNIAIEGSGNPTHLVGLLARGLHIAIEWADKSIKFYKPKDE